MLCYIYKLWLWQQYAVMCIGVTLGLGGMPLHYFFLPSATALKGDKQKVEIFSKRLFGWCKGRKMWNYVNRMQNRGICVLNSLLYKWYRLPFPEVKRPGRGFASHFHLATRLAWVELYLYSTSVQQMVCYEVTSFFTNTDIVCTRGLHKGQWRRWSWGLASGATSLEAEFECRQNGRKSEHAE